MIAIAAVAGTVGLCAIGGAVLAPIALGNYKLALFITSTVRVFRAFRWLLYTLLLALRLEISVCQRFLTLFEFFSHDLIFRSANKNIAPLQCNGMESRKPLI